MNIMKKNGTGRKLVKPIKGVMILNRIRIVYDKDYQKYLGTKCNCGYFYDEGAYELKSREDDYVKYNCESCGDSFIVILNKNFKDIDKILSIFE